MILPDSGERRQFPTGAVRDIAQGKGRCDLLPLGVLGAWTGDECLCKIDAYLRTGDTDHLLDALDAFVYQEYDDNIPHAILEVAKHFEDGAVKYGDNNWQKGIFVHCYIDSAVRHYFKYRRGDKDEPHERAFMWNLLCAIWTHKNKPEMIDVPATGDTHHRKDVSDEEMDEFLHLFCKGRHCITCPLFSDPMPCRPENDPARLKNNYNKVKEYLANGSDTYPSNSQPH